MEVVWKDHFQVLIPETGKEGANFTTKVFTLKLQSTEAARYLFGSIIHLYLKYTLQLLISLCKYHQ
jgi:hypothetical protein